MRWPFRKKATSSREEARRFYNAKDYDKAEPFLDAMLREDPTDVWALDVLSRLYMNTENHENAVPLLYRLIQLRERDTDLVKRFLHIAAVVEDFKIIEDNILQVDWTTDDEALMKKISEGIEANPASVDIAERWAEATDLLFPKLLVAYLRKCHRPDVAAIEDFTLLPLSGVLTLSEYILLIELCDMYGEHDLKLRHQVDNLHLISLTVAEKQKLVKELIRRKLNHQAIELVQNILETEPADEKSLTALTLLGVRTKQPNLVIEASKSLIGTNSLSLVAAKRFARAANRSGNPTFILTAMNALSEFDVDHSGTLREAYRTCLKYGHVGAAEAVESLCQTEVQRIDFTAIRTIHQAEYTRALNIIEDALERYPTEVLLLHRKANILRAMNDVEGCIKVCEQVLDINPQHLKISILRTEMGTKIWDDETAVREYEAMIQKFPDCVRFHHQLLNFSYSAVQDMPWSQTIIERGLVHAPKDLRLRFYQALVHAQLGEDEPALKSIRSTLRKHPDEDVVLMAAAQVQKELGNPFAQLNHVNQLLEKQNLAPLTSIENGKISPEFLSSEPIDAPESNGLVSVVMTTYKRDPLLDVAVNSILNQTYPDLELIVVDDCSPDDNFAYLQQRAQSEPRLHVFQMSENGGTYLAKNFGMQQAKGDYIAFMDSDDYAHPQKIERQIDSLKEDLSLQGVVHRCIRIDESSNIEFRGVGPFRMSCISLLIRKEVVERMGYFDSLRVGADTEFIERINAVFGNGALIEAPELTLFMMRHSSSLTGGGPFHISWRSVSGPRLMHHTNFRMWHQQIAQKKTSGYVPQHMSNRPFEVHESQKSTHYAWEEGIPVFSERVQSRHERWWAGNEDVWQKSLSAKLSGRNFVENLGLKVPELYWSGAEIEGIPEFSTLPSKFVLKPEEGWNSNNVYCMVEGTDLLSHRALSRDEIVDELLTNEFLSNKKPNIIVEELLVPEEKSTQDGLPRDYKFYCFGEKIVLVHVALRKSEVHLNQNEHHYFTPNFELIQEKVMEHRDQGQSNLPRPDCWDEMLRSVRQIGKSMGIYMRIDMFATNRGAVFGEFTPTPHGGKGYSEFADKYLGGFWKGEEGVE